MVILRKRRVQKKQNYNGVEYFELVPSLQNSYCASVAVKHTFHTINKCDRKEDMIITERSLYRCSL